MDKELIKNFNTSEDRLTATIINNTYSHITMCNPAICYPELSNKIHAFLNKWNKERSNKEE